MTDVLFYALGAVVMLLAFRMLKARNRAAALRLEPEKQADAARVGWQFETAQTALFEVFRWRGTTDGIGWVAEALRTGRSRLRRHESTTRIVRCHIVKPLPVAGPLVMLQGGADSAPLSLKLPEDGGLVSKLGERMIAAALDVGLDVRFGDEIGRQVDVAKLTSIAEAERAHPGWSVMAEPAHHAAMLMIVPAVAEVLRTAAVSPPLSVVMVPAGLAVSASTWVSNVSELTPIVNASVALGDGSVFHSSGPSGARPPGPGPRPGT